MTKIKVVQVALIVILVVEITYLLMWKMSIDVQLENLQDELDEHCFNEISKEESPQQPEVKKQEKPHRENSVFKVAKNLLDKLNKQIEGHYKDHKLYLPTKDDKPDVVMTCYLPNFPYVRNKIDACRYGECTEDATEEYCPMTWYGLTALGRQKLEEIRGKELR
jgi:hypothetical protein